MIVPRIGDHCCYTDTRVANVAFSPAVFQSGRGFDDKSIKPTMIINKMKSVVLPPERLKKWGLCDYRSAALTAPHDFHFALWWTRKGFIMTIWCIRFYRRIFMRTTSINTLICLLFFKGFVCTEKSIILYSNQRLRFFRFFFPSLKLYNTILFHQNFARYSMFKSNNPS